MTELLIAFGRGLVRVIIGLFLGTGVGLITFGLTVHDEPDFWHRQGPPGGFFLAMGVGVLTAGAVMFLLFALRWPGWRRESPRDQAATKPGWPSEV